MQGAQELIQMSVRVIKKLVPLALEKKKNDVIKIMHVCGTHEHTVTHNGLRSLMPPGLEIIAGPGCPVCVTPASAVDALIDLALDGVRVYAYGDVYKLPGTKGSLATAKAMGGNVKVVYGFLDAIKDAKEYGKEAVFFGVGFETTVVTVAGPMYDGVVPKNLKVLSAYLLTAPGLRRAIEAHEKTGIPLDGIVAPGHVSSVIGANAWKYLPEEFGFPTVVAGFEAWDYVLAVVEILRQIVKGEAKLVNEYSRVVKPEGNVHAWKKVMEVFEVTDAYWRGIGVLPKSGLRFKEAYKEYDAAREYGIEIKPTERELPPGCKCAEINLGIAKPTDCPYFKKHCTPTRPIGPCMVSDEGTCSIWARFGGGGLVEELAKEAGIL